MAVNRAKIPKLKRLEKVCLAVDGAFKTFGKLMGNAAANALAG